MPPPIIVLGVHDDCEVCVDAHPPAEVPGHHNHLTSCDSHTNEYTTISSIYHFLTHTQTSPLPSPSLSLTPSSHLHSSRGVQLLYRLPLQLRQPLVQVGHTIAQGLHQSLWQNRGKAEQRERKGGRDVKNDRAKTVCCQFPLTLSLMCFR